jgi:hypothetical protein
MFQQSILDSLQAMGFGQMGFGQLSDLTPEQIASAFQQEYGLTEEDIPAVMFQGISPEMLQGASFSTYAPQIQAQGQSMLPGLYKSLGGQAAQQAAGGFAGTSAFGKQQAGARDVYGKSMTDVLTNVRGQQSQGIGMISDLINQWHSTAQRIKGY